MSQDNQVSLIYNFEIKLLAQNAGGGNGQRREPAKVEHEVIPKPYFDFVLSFSSNSKFPTTFNPEPGKTSGIRKVHGKEPGGETPIHSNNYL